jgi:hypothetical protein
MTTSPHRADHSWSRPEPKHEASVQEGYADIPVSLSGATATDDAAWQGVDEDLAISAAADEPEAIEASFADEVRVRVGEYVATPGLPARGIVLASVLAAGGCAAVDLALTNGITLFFDLCFIVVCLVSAMAVRRRDFFTTGVLPPLLFAAVVACIAVRNPGAFVHVGGMSKAFLAGLAQHAAALVTGYAIALTVLAARVSAARSS